MVPVATVATLGATGLLFAQNANAQTFQENLENHPVLQAKHKLNFEERAEKRAQMEAALDQTYEDGEISLESYELAKTLREITDEIKTEYKETGERPFDFQGLSREEKKLQMQDYLITELEERGFTITESELAEHREEMRSLR